VSAVSAFQLVFLEFLTFAVVAGVVASLAVPFALKGTARWAPPLRHRALVLLALSPVILALAGVIATLAPSLLGLIWPEFDHCLVHPGTHVHLCLVHLPQNAGNVGSWLVVLGATAALSIGASKAFIALHGASRLGSRLVAVGSHEPRLSAHVLPISQPLCLLVGIVRPRIVVSEGLVRSVTSEELRAVLLHEQAHASRRDTLVRAVSRATTVFLWPSARDRLLSAIEVSAEQSCDEAAARAIGDRLTMAEVILKVERLLHATPVGLRPLAISFGGTAVPARVAALLEPSPSGRRAVEPMALLLLVLVAVFAASSPIHHGTETLLGALFH
jgi:Zn-dependent protease with chaperone function